MTRVVVEVAFGDTVADVVSTGGTWTDITEFVHITEDSGISITRGAEDEKSETQPGTLALQLDNSSGRFTPTNAGSPYYPNVIKNVPIRVNVATVVKNYIRNPSFEGGETGSTDTWSWATGVSVLPVGTPVQSGTRAAQVTWNASASDYFQTVVYGLTIGATYTASAYVRVPTGDAAVRVRMGGINSSASAVNDAYTRLMVSFTATASVMTLQVIPSTTPAAGDLVYVDAVQVEESSSATTFDSAAAQLHPRFFGVVNEWPIRWQGLYSTVSITATDLFKMLSRTEALRPMLTQEVLSQQPHACYPLDEESGATSGGDVSGNIGPQPAAIVQAGSGGTLAFAGGTAPLGVSGAPLLTPASASAGKYLKAALGSAFQSASVTQQILVEAWFSTSTQGRIILGLSSADQEYVLLLYLAAGTGYLTVESDQPGVSAVTTTAGSTNLADGALHHVIYDAEVKELYVDGVSIGAFGGILAVSDLSTLTVGASHLGGNIWSGSLSNVAVYANTALSATDLAGHYTAGTTGYSGETADARIGRLAGYAGIPTGILGDFTGGIAQQAELGSTPLDHLREVETTESAKLLCDRGAPSVILQSRSIRYNPGISGTLTYADLETDDIELADDDQKMVNTAIVSRPGGARQRMVAATARATYGPYETSTEVLRTNDTEVSDLGHWLVSRYADPPPELRGVKVEASTLGLSTYRALLAADISTVLTITSLPVEAPASTMTVTIEGYTEKITEKRHLLAVHTSRTYTDAAWTLDSSTYSVLGTTTRLAY